MKTENTLKLGETELFEYYYGEQSNLKGKHKMDTVHVVIKGGFGKYSAISHYQIVPFWNKLWDALYLALIRSYRYYVDNLPCNFESNLRKLSKD